MEVVVNEYIINSILKNVGLIKSKSLKDLDLVLEDKYRNIVIIITNKLDLDNIDSNCFLVKNKFDGKITKANKKVDLKKIVNDINIKTDFSSYGLFNDKDSGCESLKQLCEQISNLSEIETKKYIFSYLEENDIKDINTYINKLSRKVKSAIIILTDNNSNLILINKKEEEKNYIIRKPKVTDFAELKKIVFPYQEESRRFRKDIFSANRTYTLEEFSSLCRKNGDGYALLYEENNEILGFIEAKIKNPGMHNRRLNYSYILTLEKVMVKKEERRRKIATILYRELEKYAKRIRVNRIEVCVYNFDVGTIKFLESLNLLVQKTTYEKKLK